jgi:hypothetical protein
MFHHIINLGPATTTTDLVAKTSVLKGICLLMTYLPKSSAASGWEYGICLGCHDADAPTDYSGNLRVYFPSIHGKDVNVKHLDIHHD